MRLTVKLIIALSLAILFVLGVNAFVRINREAALFEDDMRKDSALMGRSLAGAVSRIWTTVGEAEALDLVENADERESYVKVRWLWLEEPGAEQLDAAARRHLAEGKVVVLKAPDPRDGELSLFTYVPVSLPDARPAAIELGESLSAEKEYLRKTILQAVIATLVLVLVCALLALAVGIVFVGRPVRALVEQARRIGAGDLAISQSPPGKDEIGELGKEMNAMCERLSEARAHLEAETTTRLATQEQLRHADRLTTVGKLAAGIAHEVGTPLNVITGHAQLVTEEYPPESGAYENVVIIAEQAHRVTAIIRQLLDFARQRTLCKSSQELGEITSRVSTLLTPMAQKHKVVIEVADSSESTSALIDAGQIQQVVTNLVVNGIQAMTAGGTLVVGSERVTRKDPDELSGAAREFGTIYVQDQGPGIAAADLPRIFEPFFTTKEVGDGTGLGLSVAYGIVKEHGGFIDVSSVLREGTRFTVYLPLQPIDE